MSVRPADPLDEWRDRVRETMEALRAERPPEGHAAIEAEFETAIADAIKTALRRARKRPSKSDAARQAYARRYRPESSPQA